jgi:hypothetical protein
MSFKLKKAYGSRKTMPYKIDIATHSRSIYGRSVETREPYSRNYMSEPVFLNLFEV